MLWNKNILENMSVGSYGISMGTDMALESLVVPKVTMHDNDKRPKRNRIKDYSYLIINHNTIVRNIVYSLESKDQRKFLEGRDTKKIIDVIDNELTVIEEILENAGLNISVVLFISDYKSIIKHNRNKEPNTTSIKYLVNKLADDISLDLKKLDHVQIGPKHRIGRVTGRGLMLTHNAIDGLNPHVNFDILESHTGKIVEKRYFPTKYHKYGNNDISQLPFVEPLFYVMGDNNRFPPSGVKIRKRILEISIEAGWNRLTSSVVVAYDIKKRDKAIYEIIKKYKYFYR